MAGCSFKPKCHLGVLEVAGSLLPPIQDGMGKPHSDCASLCSSAAFRLAALSHYYCHLIRCQKLQIGYFPAPMTI